MSAKAYEALSKSNELTVANEVAQNPKKKNDGDEKERKKRIKGSLIKFGSLAVFAFVVWIFATIAWFSHNTSVSGNGMGVSVAGSPFEIEVQGAKIENSDDFSKADSEYSLGTIQDNTSTIRRTSGGATKVIWRKDSLADGTYPDGLVPDSHGTLTFWVVPNRSGQLNIDFNLEVRGFHATFDEPDDPEDDPPLKDLYEITDNLTGTAENGLMKNGAPDTELIQTKKDALAYLKGHILFFSDYDETNNYYSGFLGNARTISFADCINPITHQKYSSSGTVSVEQGQKYKVVLYWKWANTLEQMVLDQSSTYKDSTSLFSVSNSTDRTAMYTYLKDTSNNKVFQDSTLSDANIVSSLNTIQSGTNIYNSLNKLTVAYNNADQIIGNNVDYLLIELTAEPS